MKITGIVCEYNPLHLGHKRQLDRIKASDSHIVCLMSGNYVQRGHPAIFDKMCRAEAALRSGADLVLELPITASLSSAEGFAAEGVRILSGFCDALSFGSETGNADNLVSVAQALLSDGFREALRCELNTGISFPAARQKALHTLGLPDSLLTQPNDILAVEYCKAILAQESSMKPEPIKRNSDYHASDLVGQMPSATAVRSCITHKKPWLSLIPTQAQPCFQNARVHTLQAGERAMLARLRTMTEDAFASLPFGSEGLWRKLMHCTREHATIEDILNGAKSKRYTHTRLSRMLMCAYLGITADMLQNPAPYVRVLAFNDFGREILKKARQSGTFINIGERTGDAYECMEARADDLFGLFALNIPEAPGTLLKQRIVYIPE